MTTNANANANASQDRKSVVRRDVLRTVGAAGALGAADPAPADPTVPIDRIRDDAVTDESGHFSSSAFKSVTGLSPAEFVPLYVDRHGGRVMQRAITDCLPWSSSTVSRLLVDLERDGALRRIRIGRENLVCTPDAVPPNAL